MVLGAEEENNAGNQGRKEGLVVLQVWPEEASVRKQGPQG